MKNTFTKKVAVLCAALCAIFLLPLLSPAQTGCNNVWTINNNTSCSIDVNYFYTCNGVSCSTGNLGVNIAANSFLNVSPCAPSCSGSCNFLVRLVRIGGVSYSGAGVDYNNQMASWNSSGCPSSPGTLVWDGVTFVVDINP